MRQDAMWNQYDIHEYGVCERREQARHTCELTRDGQYFYR